MTKIQTKKMYVYELLKQDIILGEIKPGEILNEVELAKKFNVGKTPTREALLLLTHENLLEVLPRVGYVVTQLTTKELFEIYTLRIILETEAIGMAVDRITHKEIALLEENNRQELLLVAQGISQKTNKAYQLNLEFHLTITQASGNARLVKIIQGLIYDLERALSFDPYIADPDQHKEIISSLKARDKPRAQEAMRAHLDDTMLRIISLFQSTSKPHNTGVSTIPTQGFLRKRI